MMSHFLLGRWCLFSGAFPRSFRDLFVHDTHRDANRNLFSLGSLEIPMAS